MKVTEPKAIAREIALEGSDGVNGELGDMDRDGDNHVVMGEVVWFSNPGFGVGPWTRDPGGRTFPTCGGKWTGCCSSFAKPTGRQDVRSQRAEHLRVSHGPGDQVHSPITFREPFITITDQPGRNTTASVSSNAHWKSTQPDSRKGPLS